MKKQYRFPEILQLLLDEKEMSQRKLAEILGVSHFSVNKWVNFNSTPSMFSVMAIAEIFDVSIDYLVYGDENGK